MDPQRFRASTCGIPTLHCPPKQRNTDEKMEDNMQSVLRCKECSKPFDKASTLKRHGYYCRSRRGDGAPRARSCMHCAKAKAKCDSKLNGCSRCLSKSIACRYPPGTSATARRKHSEATAQSETFTPTVAGDSIDTLMQASPGTATDTNAADPLDLDFDFDWTSPDFDFSSLMSDTESDKLAPYFPSAELVKGSPKQFSFESIPLIPVRQVEPYANLSFLIRPTDSPRSLITRPRTNIGMKRASGLLFHSLKSYPVMMRNGTIPPFIHPQMLQVVGEDGLESWCNCVSLIKMLGNGVNGSRKLFWKNVRMECERFRAECYEMSAWQMLISLQAIYVYIIIRLDEGETDHNNLDSLIVATTATLSRRMNSLACNWGMPQEDNTLANLTSPWEKWLFEECSRRLCTIFQVLNLLIHFPPAALCDLQFSGLMLAPLPSNKQLWEAPDEASWQREIDRDPDCFVPYGLSTSGELVQLEQGPMNCRETIAMSEMGQTMDVGDLTRSVASWEVWCSSMDGIGGLVMLAASLVA